MQTLHNANGAIYNILTNKQTGNAVYLVDMGSTGYLYVEQHKKITIQAHSDPEGSYLCTAVHIFDGQIAEVTDCPCLDDALTEMEQHYGELLYGWTAPQKLAL
jgi:hypothetical protein